MYCVECGEENDNNHKYCIYCGSELSNPEISDVSEVLEKPKKKFNYIALILGLFFLLVALVIFIYSNSSKNSSSTDKYTYDNTPKKEIDNTRTVVQILCDKSAGSGTMMTEEGLILTNYHVVEDEKNCVVTIPNTITGEPEEIYYASVITIPELSELYDIATLEIDSVYTDEDGKTWGAYPNKFTSFQRPGSCSDDPWKLGEPIKIFGYPATSHNYNLTVTEGIISNFSDGYILTSAKIDSGNSGGLAINQEGCMVGIPSAVLEGDYQNLGVIIPSDIIIEFLNEVSALNPEE